MIDCLNLGNIRQNFMHKGKGFRDVYLLDQKIYIKNNIPLITPNCSMAIALRVIAKYVNKTVNNWLNEVIDSLHLEQSSGDSTIPFNFFGSCTETQTQVFWPNFSKSRDITRVIYPN